MNSIMCKECNHEIHYKPVANFIVFCPMCFKYTYLECEYGYGPVTPCYIYLGEKEFGIVTEEDYKYYLKTKYSDKMELGNTYLKALEESVAIIESMIKKQTISDRDF